MGRFDVCKQIVTQNQKIRAYDSVWPIIDFTQNFLTLFAASVHQLKRFTIARHTYVGPLGNTYNANTATTAIAAADTMEREAMLTAPLVHVLVELAVI